MTQPVSGGGNRRTADLEAQRRAQEARQREQAEAARRARQAEEARRRAEEQRLREQAQRSRADQSRTTDGTQRQEGYQARTTQALSAETARLQGLADHYADRPVSRTPNLDRMRSETRTLAEDFSARLDQARDRFDDASGDVKDRVRDIEDRATDRAEAIMGEANRAADDLIRAAEAQAENRTPEDAATLMAEADRRAAAILERAQSSAESLLNEAGDIATEALDNSHEYENKSWLGQRRADIGNFLGNVWDTATDLFDRATDAVGEVADFAREQVSNFTEWVGEQAFRVVDHALDGSSLGKDNEYTQEKTGVLGDLVTNRLEVGESAFIRLDADANIGGVQLGAGAELEIKRVPATNEDGTPKLEPKDEHGEPPTELEVTLVVDARAGVGLSAQFGVAGSTNRGPQSAYGNDINPGASAGAGASVEAGAQAQAEFTFTFDPRSQQDMDDLTGIVGATAKTALPGVGALFAGDAVRAAADFGRHLTSMRGEIGLYATAQASASVGVGQIGEDDHGSGGEVRVAGTEGADGQIGASGNMVIDPNAPEDDENQHGLRGTAAGAALDAANLNVAELTAGLNGEVNLGAEHNFRTGETTVYLNVAGSAQAEASAVGVGAGAGASSDRTIAVRIKDGEIQGIDVTENMTGEQFHGVGSTDVRGRLQDGVLARVSESDSVAVTRSYTPEAMAAFRAQAGDNPTRALAGLAGQVFTNLETNRNLEITDVKSTSQSQIEFGFSVAGTGIRIAAGRRLESDLDTVEAPANLNHETREAQEAAEARPAPRPPRGVM